jgi:GNAT superfamily N-acetyltransferase
MTSLRLLPFASEDYDAWYPLWRGYQSFYRVDIPEEVTRLTWSRLLDPDEPMRGTFCLDGDDAVGIVHCVQHRSTWTRGDYLYLQDLFTAAHARGRGVGRLLIQHVYAEAAALGCSRVHWLTHETNHDAMQLYDRIADRSGFVQYRKLL